MDKLEQDLAELIHFYRDVILESNRIIGRQFDAHNDTNGSDMSQPVGLENIKLHQYQFCGIEWMKLRYDHGLSFIIADEMGKKKK